MRTRLFITAIAMVITVIAVPVRAEAATATTAASATVAASATATATPRPSKQASRTYDLDFTLPTAGKSGCTVCHGDKNLVRPSVGNSLRSLYVGAEVLAGSAHADTPCTGCHFDFAYKVPHKNAQKTDAWRDVAKQACKNCHQLEFTAMNLGAHSGAPTSGKSPAVVLAERKAQGKPTRTPLCGDCHGSHDIPRKNDKAAKAAIHSTGLEMCGGCHPDEAQNYADYYHGAAYRRGASDAPACWDCHTAHDMRPASDRLSPVHPDQLAKTCGKCHKGLARSGKGVVTTAGEYIEYAQLIHKRPEVENDVFLLEWWSSVRSALDSVVSGVSSLFR